MARVRRRPAAIMRACPPGSTPQQHWRWVPGVGWRPSTTCVRLGAPPVAGLGAQEGPSAAQVAWGVLSTASMAASAYHGYKRNQSVGWALGWGFLGALFPVITPTIAVAQGFGKRKAGR